MKVLSITAVLSAVVAVVLARDCPLESDCVQKSCKNFKVVKEPISYRWYSPKKWQLHADCKDNAGKKTLAKVFLDDCLGNLDGELVFALGGDFNCSDCKLKNTDPVVMECWCKNKGGKNRAKEINLSEGIWAYDGSMGCYQSEIRKSPGIGEF
ncbi:hypothetical protein LX32DRAFT_307579 [Colletotrichum zoysiae]|uniref:Cyanovirin-N domain-containing protein n=1 Tax=Colletotrichum zoysiae TaxID=1216348 RepID=A0AAD9HTN0_9PEZI|nr:hypothetical protein LX32DRAFT_307579 [Colletotrichum zoysiae]